ncbi:redoxin [Alteromonas sp. V450]|uniref:TlpA disulfide reductase family protein n=1 Tax=Alteromonas sp. V450 TaxID=1912139 RepID=UPI0008FF410C|nr:TlpA disulfide reductase family protein [Alteromonas sp. V450]OJF69701.1 redoxin [Alteromonas sp. V450]|tara:strand:+ start:1551 stop:2075 length:525 start_codon:yes stop_codon:yes gene_type:complete
MKVKSLDPIIGLIVCVALLLSAALLTGAEANAATKNTPASDFTLKGRDGANHRLSEEIGNIVIVNFWASWCGPCREELPAFEALHQEYADLGVTIYGVNVDDAPEKANVLLKDIKVSFPVLYDTNGEVSKLYEVSAMPTTVMVDRDGNTRLIHKGYKSGDEKRYEKVIKALLRE